jgi:AcrR family transcriptional regulator
MHRHTTRHALGRAALRLAIEHGPANVRREDIAAAADVSLRTFSDHFATEQEAIVEPEAGRAVTLTAALRARPAGEPLRQSILEAFTLPYAGEPLSREWVARIRGVVSAPEVHGAYLTAAADVELAVADAIAERLGVDPADQRPRSLAAAACDAEREAIGYWLDADAEIPLAETVRESITQVI